MTKLEPWASVRDRVEWRAILLGNGASQQVWSSFGYRSLYEVARNVENPLRPEDEVIFQRLRTRDFEKVLHALRDAHIVNEALGLEAQKVASRYCEIQRALGEAVAKTHIPWEWVPQVVLRTISSELVKHRFVFSTNYDLLVYWAILCDDPRPQDVKDFFWTPGPEEEWLLFDPSDTETPKDVTRVLYLHGGLHLYSLFDGSTAKYVPAEGENLLDAFQRFMRDQDPFGPIPLLVTEGDPEDKRAVIESSSYLSFGYQKLVTCQEPIVVFGHALGDSDIHIAKALNRHLPIAISLLPGTPEEIKERQAHYEQRLPRARLHFFDATTHPLGDSSLRIDPEE